METGATIRKPDSHPDSRPGPADYLPVIAVTMLLTAAIYVLTLSQSVGWHDSAELAITAYLPGASHAPGSPLHSLLGHLASLLSTEVYRGTALLSLVMAVTAAVLLAVMVLLQTGRPVVAVLAALAFAFSSNVWANAVVTEVYSLGVACLAAALLSATLATRSVTAWRLNATVLFYCLSLAAYFANIILWPWFAWFVWYAAGRRLSALLAFAAASGTAVVLIALGNFLLARNALPFGAIRPDSISGLLLYMTGSQHEPLQVRTLTFLASRFVEHAGLVLRSTGILGALLALAGIPELHRRMPALNVLLAGVVCMYLGYYTVFGPGDYYLMVAPAYFGLFVWAGCGAVWLIRVLGHRSAGVWVTAVFAAYVVGLVGWQISGRMAMARDRAAENFAGTALEYLPADAVVVLGYRELTTLTYFQTVTGQRPDLTLLLPARETRYYLHDRVDDYVSYVAAVACTRPVFALKPYTDVTGWRSAEGELGAGGWYRLSGDTCDG